MNDILLFQWIESVCRGWVVSLCGKGGNGSLGRTRLKHCVCSRQRISPSDSMVWLQIFIPRIDDANLLTWIDSVILSMAPTGFPVVVEMSLMASRTGLEKTRVGCDDGK